MAHFYLAGFIICWCGLGIVGAGFYGGDAQRVNDEIDLFDLTMMLFLIPFGPLGLLIAWIASENREMTWITLPAYKSKGQRFLEKLES